MGRLSLISTVVCLSTFSAASCASALEVEPDPVVEPEISSQNDALLPYAERGDTLPPPYPRFEIGFGLSGYFPQLGGLSPAFTAVEEQYREQGYNIGYHNSDFRVGPVYWSSFSGRWSRWLSTVIQGGIAIATDVDFSTISASMLYHLPIIDGTPFEPFVGAGGGLFSFSATRKYDLLLYSTPFPGYNQYLDNITVKGSTFGLIVSCGLRLTSPLGSRGGLSIDYLHASEMTTKGSKGVKGSINPGSVMVGLQVLFQYK